MLSRLALFLRSTRSSIRCSFGEAGGFGQARFGGAALPPAPLRRPWNRVNLRSDKTRFRRTFAAAIFEASEPGVDAFPVAWNGQQRRHNYNRDQSDNGDDI